MVASRTFTLAYSINFLWIHHLWRDGTVVAYHGCNGWRRIRVRFRRGSLRSHRLDPLLRHEHSIFNLKRVTAWILRFVTNTRSPTRFQSPYLAVSELTAAENYWLRRIQLDSFLLEVEKLEDGCTLPKNSKLSAFRPFWDKDVSLICVGGRLVNSQLSFSQSYPVILHGKHSAKVVLKILDCCTLNPHFCNFHWVNSSTSLV